MRGPILGAMTAFSALPVQRSSRLLLLLATLIAGLAFAQSAHASACPGAGSCPWTSVTSFGDLGDDGLRGPSGLAADGDGNLFVISPDSNRVLKRASNGTFLASWGREGSGAGEFTLPTDLAVDAGHGVVYVSDTENNRVDRFDANGVFLSSFGADQLFSPRGIATDGANVYVADRSTPRIVKYDLSGAKVGAWAIPNGQAPARVAVSAGKVYVTTTSSTVWRFDTSGVPDSSWDGDGVTGSLGSGAGQLDHPQGVTVDGSGVYVADTQNDRIVKYDANGAPLMQWGIKGSGDGQFFRPAAVLATGGGVWVADSANHRLQRFSQTGTHQLTVGSLLGPGDFYFPTDVAVAANGDLYVADRGANDIQRMSAAGNPLARWTASTPRPFSVTPTADGIYVPETNQVSHYDPAGTLLGGFGSLGSGPGRLHFPAGSTADPRTS